MVLRVAGGRLVACLLHSLYSPPIPLLSPPLLPSPHLASRPTPPLPPSPSPPPIRSCGSHYQERASKPRRRHATTAPRTTTPPEGRPRDPAEQISTVGGSTVQLVVAPPRQEPGGSIWDTLVAGQPVCGRFPRTPMDLARSLAPLMAGRECQGETSGPPALPPCTPRHDRRTTTPPGSPKPGYLRGEASGSSLAGHSAGQFPRHWVPAP